MSATHSRRRPHRPRSSFIQKPRGAFHPRVQRVGPEHFGIVSVDCAKARSQWMLCDFYGNVLIPPTVVAHNRPDLDAAVAQVRAACAAHEVHDLLVAIERTGRYHHVPRQAFAAAGCETRIVHPFATKQYRQPSDPGNKTDDTDLTAIHRAAVAGFALAEPALDAFWQTFRLLTRHRRDLVHKTSTLCCQIREHLEAARPGYAACFPQFWERAAALRLVHHFPSAAALLAAGAHGLAERLRGEGTRCHRATLDTVLTWAAQAPAPEVTAPCHRQLALDLDDDRQRKTQEILALERQIAAHLVRTPYVLLLALPGVGVVSTADFAAEMGPIPHYASARAITGRAGLYPSRRQSDRVDHANGPLVRCANRRLRAAILAIADNLIQCNHHFNALAVRWRAAGKDPRHTHVKVALRFCRIAFQLVAGRQAFRHPSIQQRSYILDKLNAFHRDHETPIAAHLGDLQAAIEQLPKEAYAREAQPLAEELRRIEAGRRWGPQPLGDILPLVLARLGVEPVQYRESGEQDPR
jgi:transposase